MSLDNDIKNAKVIILDFDGTVADTEKYSWIAHNQALKNYGIILSEEHIKKYIGNNDKIIFSMIENDFGIKIDFDSHFKNRLDLYLKNIIESDLKPFDFILDLFEKYSDKKFYILSSNSKSVIYQILKKWGLHKKFEQIYSMLDLNSSKKFFLQNAEEKFGCKIEEIVLFEDSAKVINMANLMGAKTVFIENNINKHQQVNYDFKIRV